MAETQRTIADIYTLLSNNVTGAISPTDLRDSFETWRMSHGQIYIPATNATATTISDTTSYFEVTAPAWSLTTGAASHNFDESAGNGRLTYTGTEPVTVHVAFSYSMTTASNNQVTHFRVGVDGTTDVASEVQRKVGTGTDVGAGACHLISTLTTGQYLSVFVRNSTSASNVTVVCCNLQAVGMTQ
jgi:hypothetical protein